MRKLMKWALIAIVILALLLVAVYAFFIGYRYWAMTYSDPAEKQACLAYSKEKVATVILNDRLAPKSEITAFTQAEALSHLKGIELPLSGIERNGEVWMAPFQQDARHYLGILDCNALTVEYSVVPTVRRG
ncbi:TPA: hypothetical protein SLG95_003600 [Serratia liquefaciens]|nr:hypothetical protein [Serratia liquefaciens]